MVKFYHAVEITGAASNIGDSCTSDSTCDSYGQYCKIYSNCAGKGQCSCKSGYESVAGACKMSTWARLQHRNISLSFFLEKKLELIRSITFYDLTTRDKSFQWIHIFLFFLQQNLLRTHVTLTLSALDCHPASVESVNVTTDTERRVQRNIVF